MVLHRNLEGHFSLAADLQHFIYTTIDQGQRLEGVVRGRMGTSPWSSLSPDAIVQRAWTVLRVNWLLGFTAFGGPPVHFKIVSILRSFIISEFERS